MPTAEELALELACTKDELKRIADDRWIFEDPRHTIYKRCNIIILRPNGPAGIWRAARWLRLVDSVWRSSLRRKLLHFVWMGHIAICA